MNAAIWSSERIKVWIVRGNRAAIYMYIFRTTTLGGAESALYASTSPGSVDDLLASLGAPLVDEHLDSPELQTLIIQWISTAAAPATAAVCAAGAPLILPGSAADAHGEETAIKHICSKALKPAR